jgi:cytochrome c5
MPAEAGASHRLWGGWVLSALLTLLFACNPSSSASATSIAVSSSPVATPDRLAEPALPADPTQYEQGRHLYWLNCMPCHGDSGQGLTGEFRSLWEEDHQNCWARGCHAGRVGDGGFPLPRTIPGIISSSGNLPVYATPETLYDYLCSTHPPQRPGALTEGEYWALTAYVLAENGCLSPDQELGP